ncbi:MAG: NAD(+) synthase [Kiritimatiellia bacterium]
MTKPIGYLRLAAAVPPVRPGDIAFNRKAVGDLIAGPAREVRAEAVVFPELCLTGYTAADLFYRSDLLGRAEAALAELVAGQRADGPLVAVGLPIRQSARIFNCAAVFQGRRLLGVVPKTHLPNTREFYEARWFASALEATAGEVDVAGFTVPFGNDLVFDLGGGAVVGVEICEDMWAADPPATNLALNGANAILNLSASNELVGKADYRRSLVTGHSARLMCAYVYAGAGVGESTSDLVFGGHALIAENGTMLAEGKRFGRAPALTVSDVDVDFLDFERSANFAYRQSAKGSRGVRKIAAPRPRGLCRVPTLLRELSPHPFVPDDGDGLDARAAEILAMQAAALATRLESIGCRHVTLGLSGGLDSALALLVCVEAFRLLRLDRAGIHAFSMPGFGTTGRTRTNAEKLCRGLGVPLETVAIGPIARLHLADIGHDEATCDTTYENVQARLRTTFLMDKANQLGAIVIGTGDLSELALGWCTYNGDHMSMYNVNCGVPKTLVKYIVRACAARLKPESEMAAEALADILATPISPELLPAADDGSIAQMTEEKVGPYELHDFFLYHFLRRGAAKEKLSLLANIAFAGRYAPATIEKWLAVFLHRFRTQQYKRNAVPDGPKIGTIGLSPRGDWRMPSDIQTFGREAADEAPSAMRRSGTGGRAGRTAVSGGSADTASVSPDAPRSRASGVAGGPRPRRPQDRR